MDEQNPAYRAKFIYNITVEEQDKAIRTSQRKFGFKGNIIKTVAFSLLALLFIQQVITNPKYTLGWTFSGVCIFFIVYIWYNQYKLRKTYMLATEDLADDRYEFELYDDHFSIRTILPEDEEEESDDEQGEIPPTEVYFDKEVFAVIETDELFLLFLKKQTMFTVPKRCITKADISEMQSVFAEKLEEDFIVTSNKSDK